MKQYQRSLAVLAVLACSLAGTVRAQSGFGNQFGVQPLWDNYAVQTINEFYNPLAGGTVLPGIVPGGNPNVPVEFVNFTGAIDMQDGVASGIPVGFTFNYNGSLTDSVNIAISGWVSFNIVDLPPGATNLYGPWGPTQKFVPVEDYGVPVTPANNNDLFSSVLPNNTVAPYWGTHYYRTTEAGYYPSTISYLTSSVNDPNPNKNSPFAQIKTFTVEWRDLNVNDRTNPNSVASFQLIIHQNPLANDLSAPDQRAIIEFQYGAVGPPNGSGGSGGTVDYIGAAVGANDSAGFTHINALYQTASDPNDVANNTSTRTTTWPPTGQPGRAIQLVPEGQTLLANWGDGDVLLQQLYGATPDIRNNQSLFVTVADAQAILEAYADATPLDSIEGGAAFHGDANHTSGPGALEAASVNTASVSTTSSVFTSQGLTGYFPGEQVTFQTTGTLPAPLQLNTVYYISPDSLGAFKFEVSASYGGPPVTITTAGSPTAFFVYAASQNPDYAPAYGTYFYYTTPYDAAYILMYLAGKLAYLPWPSNLPVPGYKTTENNTTSVSGIVADVSNASRLGNTVLLPITVRGNVNGPLSIQMELKGLDASGLQLVGTEAPDGTLMSSNPSLGRVALATHGEFSNGETVGYIELLAPANANPEFDIENVKVNDLNLPSSHVALMLADGSQSTSSTLEQNVPNPFVVSVAGETTIGFNLASPEDVTLRIIDVLGHEVRTLISGEGRTAGYNSIQWDGRDGSGNLVPTGMYFYQLTTPDFTQCAKMQVVH